MRTLTLLVCAALALSAAAQEKTYDLRLEAPLRAGQKSRLVETSHMKMTVRVNGEVASESEEKTNFEAIESVVQSDGKGNAELRHSYLKAERLVDGQMKPYGFQGRAITVKRVKGQPDRFTYADGARLSKEDLEALSDAFFTEDGDDDDATSAFAPSKPVRIGESWSPDVKVVAKMFSDEETTVDASGSKVRLRLKSVEQRGGVEYGKIDGVFELAMRSLGPLTFETPILMKIALDMDVCIDGTSEDGVLKMKLRIKDSSSTRVEDTKMKIDLDMAVDGDMSQTTIP